MSEKVRVLKEKMWVDVEKKKLISLFLKKLAAEEFEYLYCKCNDIMENIDDISTIQIYKDDVVRVHFKQKQNQKQAKSIILNYAKSKFVKNVLEELF